MIAAPAKHDQPANVEAEQALLGSILYDNLAAERVEFLEPEHFYEPFHQRLYAEIIAMIRRGQLADPILLGDFFQADPAFKELGGVAYLGDLVDRAPPAANAGGYGKAIYNLALRRDLIRITDDLGVVARSGDSELTPEQMIEVAEAELFRVAEQKVSRGPRLFREAARGAMETAAEALNRGGGLSGTPTGLIDLDRRLGGLHPTDLIILAARPSMGKTALATNVGFKVARAYSYDTLPDGSRKTVRGGVVAFFSLEMSEEQLAMRIMADVADISSERIRRGDLSAEEYGRLRDVEAELAEIPLYIDDEGALSIDRLCQRARRLKRTVGLDLVIVDYLQLVTVPGRRGRGEANRVQEIAEITQRLKALAKELKVPVLALSQLSRKVEERDDKRPQLADLRESGAIEQDADVVMFLYREAYYLARKQPDEGSVKYDAWRIDMDRCAGLAEAIIGKQRHGPIGTVKLAFDEKTTRFSNLARDFEHAARNPAGGD